MSMILQSTLRQIQWGSSFSWDIQFPATSLFGNGTIPPPPPFSDWFPAVTVDEPVYSLELYTVTTPLASFGVPVGSGGGVTLPITFIDDEFGTLREWLREWVVNYILGNGFCVRTLQEVVRPVFVRKFSRFSENGEEPVLLSQRGYWVHPTQQVKASWNSESSVMQYPVYFNVVGGIHT